MAALRRSSAWPGFPGGSRTGISGNVALGAPACLHIWIRWPLIPAALELIGLCCCGPDRDALGRLVNDAAAARG